jgi:hypothetical protein
MSDNLQDLITKTLGVVHTAPAAPKFASSAVPERPEPEYEFRISVYRSEYGSAYIRATSADAAFDQASSDDIQWDDCGEIQWDGADTEQMDDEPVNQQEIDEWDDKYGRKYTSEGTPKCTACDDEMSEKKLRQSPNDDNEWFCDDCYDDNV